MCVCCVDFNLILIVMIIISVLNEFIGYLMLFALI